MKRANNPYVVSGIEQLQTRWPQSHSVLGKYGHHLVVVPSVLLPKGYRENICTVLFVVPPGYPAACPDHFFTDIEIRLNNSKSFGIPYNTNLGNGAILERLGWPQWKNCMWWSWHLQMWNPNQSSLYTYMQVILQRLKLEK
jgi:Prokaryotic E2 family E